MSKLAESPLAQGIAKAAADALKRDVRRRCEDVADEPLGVLVKNIIARKRIIESEGREVTAEDVRNFLNDVPAIVADAQQKKAEQKG